MKSQCVICLSVGEFGKVYRMFKYPESSLTRLSLMPINRFNQLQNESHLSSSNVCVCVICGIFNFQTTRIHLINHQYSLVTCSAPNVVSIIDLRRAAFGWVSGIECGADKDFSHFRRGKITDKSKCTQMENVLIISLAICFDILLGIH